MISIDPPSQPPIVFGKYTIGDVVKWFDFKDINVTDNTREDFHTAGLAPSFGTLDAESIIRMDENLKIAIAGTTKLLSDIPTENRSWEAILAIMRQNPLLEPVSNEVRKSESFIVDNIRYFKFDRSLDEDVATAVKLWFNGFINDGDVLDSTQINIDTLSDLVAQTDAKVECFRSLTAKTESHYKTLVDIGFLRYPDIGYPYFKIFRIQLTAWSKCDRVLVLQHDSNGIKGEYRVREFKPRDSVINGMSKEPRQTAIREAEALFC